MKQRGQSWLKRYNLTPALLVALGLLLVALFGLVVGTDHLIRKDQAALLADFSQERLEQVRKGADAVGNDLAEVVADLQFAGHLVQSSLSTEERRRVLTALLGSVKPYRAAAVYHQDGSSDLTITDPRVATSVSAALLEAMASTARRAAAGSPGRVETSFPIEDPDLTWHRVFAMPLVEPQSPGKVVAFLVDTAPFLEKLRLLAADPRSHLLIFGPHGRTSPMSEPRLDRAVRELEAERPGLAQLGQVVARMRAGAGGILVIDQAEASRMGFEQTALVAAFAPIPITGSSSWAVGMFTSTRPLQALEQQLMERLILVSAGIALVLILFGSYVLTTLRRAAVLRERLRHASELAHAREIAEKILENIPTGVLALSRDGRITSMNQALRRRLSGTTPVRPTLAGAFPHAPPGTLGRIEALVEQAREQRASRSLLVERLALFGEEGTFSIHAVPLEHDLGEASMLLVLEDFTEVRTLESQLLRSEKLATVGILAAGVAHELGTPLGIIRGRAEYILGRLGTEHRDAAGLRTIMEQIDRVTGTIRELLDFSRIRPPLVTPLALEPLLLKVVELLRYETSRRNLRIDCDVAAGLPALAADGDQLQQVLINLLLNACAASREGAGVRIVARPGQLTATGWHHVRVEIRDEGTGIPPDVLHRVFDPFFTTKKRGQGTGLGLTIVSQIVRNHGAEIELESEVGAGTRAILRWPTATTTPGGNHDASSQGPDPGRR